MPSISSILRAGFLAFCTLTLASCIIARHPAGIASSTHPLPTSYTALGAVEESSCGYRVLFLPVGGKDPTDQVIDRAIKQKGGDALVGVTVEQRSSTLFLPVVASDCTVVNGLAVKKGK
ncbi:MAG: hypothetical protein ACREIS_05040 [Nitrospiraceae bacterium]